MKEIYQITYVCFEVETINLINIIIITMINPIGDIPLL